MDTTFWEIGDVLVLEPVTALTDILVTAVSFYASARLWKASKARGGYLREYPLFFLSMGIGTLAAALMTHAFSYLFVDQARTAAASLPWPERFIWHLHDLPNWLFNIAAMTFFEIAVVKRSSEILHLQHEKALYLIIAVETAAIVALTFAFLTYDVAAGHIVFAMLILSLPLQIRILSKDRKNAESILILAATGTMLVVLTVMVTRFSISRWFNYNDISHCLIAVTMLLTYLSAERTMLPR